MAADNVIDQPHLLLVEGIDEVNFFTALLRHLNITTIQVMQSGGKDKFKAKLKAIKSTPDFDIVTTMGVIRDCDGNRRGSFDSVCSALRGADLPVPARPFSFSDDNPHVTVMIMPPTEIGTDRMLEDLCLEAVTADSAMICVNQYFDCLEEQGISLGENVLAKAKIHTFLASKDKPDLRLGEAAQVDYWPWENEIFDPTKQFLRDLANDSNDHDHHE